MATVSTSYFGGKSGSGTYQTIINQIPPHRVYVELFGGMLGILRHKRHAKYSVVVEKDSRLMATYTAKFGLRKITDLDDILRKMEVGGIGKDCFEADVFDFFDDHRSFTLMDKEDTFVYADPPYPLHTRSSDTKYRHELTDEEHVELLNLLNMFNHAKVAFSTYPNDIYYEYFMGRYNWRFIEFESQTRHGKAIEQLWMNYPEPTELHDYRHLGSDYRERERITRKLKRWEAKFSELAPLEQKAMISRLTTTMDPTTI
jgi:DNA adenine methylase